jgi:tRNA(Ile)-lysidine synthase
MAEAPAAGRPLTAEWTGPAASHPAARDPAASDPAAAGGRAPLAQVALGDALLARCDFPAAPSSDPTALAVSGGPDSLALLVLAVRAGLDVVAVHIDHGLRPGSSGEAEVVAAAAVRYGAAFESRSVAVPPGPDLEARARQARYRALPPGVLTGHTMDDQAETVLLAMLRGAALDGLAGMRGAAAGVGPVALAGAASAGRPRRPLLGLRRSETVALCAAEGLHAVEDPSNRDPRFRRNRVRAEVLPLLSEVAGRDVIPILARQAQLLAGDADLLEALSAGIDPSDTRQLTASPTPLARRAVRRWLRGAGSLSDAECHPPSAGEVARVLAVARGDVRACELAGRRRVERSGGRLRVTGR